MGHRRSRDSETTGPSRPVALDLDLDPRSQRATKSREHTFSPGARIARYTVLDIIGAGGIGIVYACYDPDLDRKVAVKLLRPSKLASGRRTLDVRRRRMLREAKALARLSHPNVVPIYEVGTFQGQIYLVMESVDGTTLSAWLKREAHQWRAIVSVFLQAARGLAAAHTAGIVHRDFKPDNVLVGVDGRVRVLDFGLATPLRDTVPSSEAQTLSDMLSSDELALEDQELRSELQEFIVANARDAEDGKFSDDGIPPEDAQDVTREGQIIGTPAYMAPEQARGEQSDARSDQFSLCVAVYEAIYGSRPFLGKAGAPQHYLDLGSLRTLPGQRPTDMPSKVEKVLLRGLSLDPHDRFPTVDALILALQPLTETRRLGWLPLVLGLATVFSAGALAWSQLSPRLDVGVLAECDGGAARLRTVWNPTVSAEFERRLAPAGLPYADKTWSTIVTRLDRFMEDWEQARLRACEASKVHGRQSLTVFEQRDACLDQQLTRIEVVLTDLLAQELPASELLSRMQALSTRLPNPERCDADDVLSQGTAGALNDADAREFQRRIAEIDGLTEVGEFTAAIAAGEALQLELPRIDSDRIRADVLVSLGRALVRQSGDEERAIALLSSGAMAAQRVGHDRAVVRAATELIDTFSRDAAKLELADHWAALGLASLAHIGDDPELAVELHISLGDLAMTKGDFEAALESQGRELAVLDELGGDRHPRYASVLVRVGDAQRELGRYDEAGESLERALALAIEHYGPEHPDVATTMDSLANVRASQHRYSEALELHRRSLELSETLLGTEHRDVARTLNNIAIIFDETGRYEEALASLERARKIIVPHVGEAHPDVAFVDVNIGSALQNLGRFDEAIARYRQALDVLTPSLGEDHVAVGVSLQNLAAAKAERGEAQGRQEDFLEALVDFEASRAVLVPVVGNAHPAIAALEHNRSRALRGLGRLDEALAAGQRSLAILETNFGDIHPELVESLVGLSQTQLARGERAHARSLAARALRLAKLDGGTTHDRSTARAALRAASGPGAPP